MDLLLELPRPARRRADIERSLRDAIVGGALPAGGTLPSTRALAAQLGVARGTVVAALDQLVVEGLVETRRGAPTRVRHVPARADEHTPFPVESEAPAAPFSGGDPDLTLFPSGWWASAVRKVLTYRPASELGYGDPLGHRVLREAVAAYVRRTRGVVADADHVAITAGFTPALALLARALGDSGVDAIGVEDPSLWVHRQVLDRSGRWVVPIPVDGEGLDVEALGAAGASAVLVTPAHQTPMGVTLSPARRAALAGWAAALVGGRAAERFVIEDDYDGELRYDRRPVPALQALDPARIVYAGTASKALVPGLRLGWLVVPDRLLVRYVGAVEAAGGSPVSAVEQLALAELLTSGRYDRHVRSIRNAYRRRRDELVRALEAIPGVRVEGIAAGLKALVRLPAASDEDAVIGALAERSVAVMGLGWYRATARADGHPDAPPGLVVNFGAPYGHQFRDSVERLAAALAEVVGRPRC